ncbi:MAG: sulfatase-like hydrolase/transferase [Terriglobia bacterium]
MKRIGFFAALGMTRYKAFFNSRPTIDLSSHLDTALDGSRKRTHLVLPVVLSLAAGFWGACRSAHIRRSSAPRNANVVLITLDTTRADHLSCYRPRGAKTPHLDALAARGVRFAHATAQVPLTLPSHACIMTGAYPEVNGLRDMGGFILAKSHPTIASVTQAAGYQTAAFVGSRVLSRAFGLANGFETYDDNMAEVTGEGVLPGNYAERRASVVTDLALGWLRQHGQKRFFLWAHYYDPHAPYDPPQPYKHLYAQDLYSGEIAYMDEQVGRLLDGIKQEGLDSRTLIAVIGDHGESLGEHGEMTHGIFLYDATMHVPFIMAGPAVPSGKVIDEEVRSIDVMPTILGFLHLSPGKEAEGVSLWPLIDHGYKVGSGYAYMETLYPRTYMGWSELRSMRTDTWKFILAPHPELYNLDHDPEEHTNVIARFPTVAGELDKGVWQVTGLKSPQQELTSSPVDPQTRQALESLGYVNAGAPRVIELGTEAPDPKDRIGMLKVLSETEQALNQHQYARAARLMQRGLKMDPTNPLAHVYLATAYEGMGDYQRAIHVYQQALSMKLETDEIDARIGKDYLRLHQLPQAIQAMSRANQINPTRLDNLRNLGTAELELGRVDDAEKAFKAIILQNDRYSAAWNGLGLVAIQRGEAGTALQDFRKAVATGPNEVEPLLNLGLLCKKTGDNAQAIHYFEMFLAKAPKAQYGSLFGSVRAAIHDMNSH